MALPTSGQLAASAINRELRRGASAELSIDTAENGGYVRINGNSPSRPNSANPASYSEWYGYNHTAGPSGPRLFPLPEVGYAGNTSTALSSLDTACRNSTLRPGRYWGSDNSVIISASDLQFWTNSAGTTRPPAGYYAQFGSDAIYWNGTSPTRLEACRI